MEETARTQGLFVDQFTYDGIKFAAFDLGGQKTYQMIYEPYLRSAVSVVYVIDSSDPSRFEESAELLRKVTSMIPCNATLLVLANKSDLVEPSTIEQIVETLRFDALQKSADLSRINMFFVSAKTGDQFDTAFEWLAKSVTETQTHKPKKIN